MRAAIACSTLLLGCAHVDHQRTDHDQVQAALAARLGASAELAAVADLDPALAEGTLELLRSPLTEDAALRIALLENRDVRAALARFGIARAELTQASRLKNPVLDAHALFHGHGGAEIELGLAQPLIDLFHRPLRERLAGSEFEAARAAVTHELVHLAFSVRRAFVNVRAAQQLAALQRHALAAAVSAHALTEQLHAAGNTTDAALAAARLGESRARLDLATTEQAAAAAREPLQTLLGLWGPHTTWAIEGALPPDPLAGLDLARAETRSIAASLDLQQHRARIDALAQGADLASWRAWLPDAHLGLLAKREPGDGWHFGPAAAVELPLLDSGAARQDRAAAALREALQRHVQIAVEIRSAARLRVLRLTGLAERLRFCNDTHLPLRAALLQRTLQHYNAMQIGAFDVLRERQQQLADEREQLQLLRDTHLAALDVQELFAGSQPPTADSPWPTFGGPPTNQPTGAH